MYETAASCKDICRIPVTNWEPHGVTLAGYCYAVRWGMKFQLVTPYRVSHWQRYGATVRGNVTVCTDRNGALQVMCALPDCVSVMCQNSL